MTEEEWLASANPAPMLEFVRGKTSDRKLRLFACGVCRQLAPLVGIDEYVRGIEAAESYVDGGRMRAAMKRCRQALDKRLTATVDSSGRGQSQEWHALYLGHLAICENNYRNFAANLSDIRSGWRGDPFGEILRNPHLIARDTFGNPFRPVAVDPGWLTSTVVDLARGIYADRAFDRLPILADALQDAGCENPDVLDHCRGPGPHVRGCWVVDLVLGLS
jgi:hypothetical protein